MHPSWTSLDNTSLEGRRIRLLADAAGLDPDDGETFFWVFAFLLFDYVFVCYVFFSNFSVSSGFSIFVHSLLLLLFLFLKKSVFF